MSQGDTGSCLPPPPDNESAAQGPREAHYVHDEIAWATVHRTTRTQPTVTTFGWRGKLVWSAPPYLVLAFWTYAGAFNHAVIALGIGVPMLWAALWWTKQVWANGSAPRLGSAPRPRGLQHPTPAVHLSLSAQSPSFPLPDHGGGAPSKDEHPAQP